MGEKEKSEHVTIYLIRYRHNFDGSAIIRLHLCVEHLLGCAGHDRNAICHRSPVQQVELHWKNITFCVKGLPRVLKS